MVVPEIWLPTLSRARFPHSTTRRSTAGPIHLDDLEATAVHHTADPEVIIVELVTRATITSTGRTFTGRSIQVFRIRDGQIVLFRDYFNPRGLDELIGA